MTQENDSTSSSGVTPDKSAVPAKKSGTTARKPSSRKPASGNTATAGKTVASKPVEPAGEEKKSPQKPRATAKRTAKAATAPKTAPQTAVPAASNAVAAEEKPAAAKKTVKSTRTTKAKKPAKPQTTPAATEKPVAEKPAAAPETPVTPAKPAGKAPQARPAAPVKAETPAVAPKEAEAAVASEQTTKKNASQNTRRGTSSKRPAKKPAAKAPAEKEALPQATASAQPLPTAPSNAQLPAAESAPAQVDAPSPKAPLATNQAETQTEGVSEAPAKPASRRSRRGGRRRNKSKNAALEKAARENAAQNQPTQEASQQQDLLETPVAAVDTEAPQPDSGAEPVTEPKARPQKNTSQKAASSRKAPEDEAQDDEDEAKSSGAERKMFISVLSGELVEVILAEEGAVVEYYVEMQHQAKVKGNIYKGVVSNIDANLQAAFISYAGGVKNGFLQIDEVHPEYYTAHHEAAKGRKYPPIQKVLKPGQEILVQVVKEPAGTKGAFLTSYLSLPGRFLVLTPGREQIGVSRKVESDEERVRLRALLEGLKPGKGLGVIVRTASTGTSKTNLQRDLQFLKRLWKEVRAKGQTASAPSLIYEELDLSTRAVRDYLTDDVQDVWVDDAATSAQVTELATLLFPKKQNLVHLHSESAQSLFERFSLQRQLDHIHSREVALPSGGSLVIDKTEALTAIDINSGRSSGKTTFEDMAYRTNMEAAKAIPLQLRLRDIGGQIVADFIEMRDRDHWREVEKIVRNGMKGDRARYDVGKISPFGMLEIVRQRLGSSAISISTEACPCCKGTGIRRNLEWQAMQALRDINKQLRQAAANNQTSLTYPTETELAFYLLNTKRGILQNMENESGVSLSINPKTE